VTAVALLDGLNVVDLGVGMAAALTAKMLVDLGASVTRIAPEGGDPFAETIPAYGVWRRGETPATEPLETLLAGADVCILGGDDHPDLVRRDDAAAIAARHPRLVVLDLTAGPDGWAGPSTELLAQVRSGLVWEQEPDRPIVNAFEPASYGAALQGLIGLLGALYERADSGRGQVVTTSLFEGALPWIGTYWARLEKPTPMADFVIPRGVAPLIFRTRDGHFIHMAIGGAGSKYGFYQALGIDDPSVQPGDSGMPRPGGSRKDFFGDWDLLAAHVARWDAGELLARIAERGLPAELVQDPGQCWDEPQIARNGIIVTDPDGVRHVGLPFLVRPLGEAVVAPRGAVKKPLEGVRVVDCGAFVAGPLAGVYLAELGADVIKVEPRAGDPNRSIFKSFSVANHGKRVIGVDMKHPEGLRVVQRLCAEADVVMNNFRPGAAARLGIDPDSLKAVNPGLIVLEAPAFGNEGPLALKAGFDMVMQAWVGHETKAAGTGNDPRWNRTNLVDIAGGMLGAVAVMAALVHRRLTGRSVALESPLCNAGIYTLSELIGLGDGRFVGVPELDADLSGYSAYEALYRAADGWVAVVARGPRAERGLIVALGLAEGADRVVLAEAIGALDTDTLVARLGAQGVWVEPCRDGQEARILGDTALIARGTVRATAHAQFGTIAELGAGFALSRSATGNDLPAPVAGQHTRALLAELGYQDAAADALYAAGAVV
jgi:crotonobetainyl-CoA:carnitine CoA-transferase CaiB-like acyl-CoA transferase